MILSNESSKNMENNDKLEIESKVEKKNILSKSKEKENVRKV